MGKIEDPSSPEEGESSRMSISELSDDDLIQLTRFFESLLTEDIENRVREFCIKNGIPWISPDFYFPVFILGMTRIKKFTADFALQRCLQAENPDDPQVALSIATSLTQDYKNKLDALKKIADSKKRAPELVEIDQKDLQQAENAYWKFMGSINLELYLKIPDVQAQRAKLREYVERAQQEVLPKIETASQPVILAGTLILNIILDEIENQKQPTRELSARILTQEEVMDFLLRSAQKQYRARRNPLR